MLQFKFKDILINLDFFFFTVIAVLFTFFPNIAPPLIFTILIHESAHLLAMGFFGIKVKNVYFQGAGIILTPTEFFLPFYQTGIIALSGAFMNFLIFAIFRNIENVFAMCNFYIGLLCIMPSKGFDGGTILLNIYNSKRLLKFLSIFSVIFLGIFMLFTGFNIFLVIITFFIITDNV
jgi:hypothetical protein